MINYRDYQQKLHDETFYAWRHHNVVGDQSPTGSGKTVLFCGITRAMNKPTVALAHRQELVSQMSRTFARNGIEHSIVGSRALIRAINKTHLVEFNRTFYKPNAKVMVASVDSLITPKRYQEAKRWGKEIGLWIMDEGHHLLRDNKWGRATELFPNAKGLGVSAWFGRSDGKGVGAEGSGLYETIIHGPQPIDLIRAGHLSPFKMYGVESDIDMTGLTIGSNGDYSQRKLIQRARKSHIVGDVVEHYLKLAPGKLGVTFVTDIETAEEVAAQFNAAGVPAAAISSKTPDAQRVEILRKFARREIIQIVNVDILGEGFDCPAIECVSFARPTASYSLFIQQFGRALRILAGKAFAVIIDHVGNVMRFNGAPLTIREPMLHDAEKRSSSKDPDEIKLKTCTKCLSYYEAYLTACSECGFVYKPEERSKPEFVEGDLVLLDSFGVDEIMRQIEESEKPPASYDNDGIVDKRNHRLYVEKMQVKQELKDTIALWAGVKKAQGFSLSERYRMFYNTFRIDVASAQALNKKDSIELTTRIRNRL